MNRVAVVDCGTNSLRLLIAEWASPDRADTLDVPLRDLVREMRIVRLGEGVDRTGRLSEDAMSRTLSGVTEYRDLIDDYQVGEVRFVGTSAMRDAANGKELTERVQSLLGVVPEVIAGSEEASLSFRGATATLAGQPAAPTLVVDIGGGSTEFVVGFQDVETARSIDMGSVRVTERFSTDPTNHAGIDTAAKWVDTQLDRVAETADLGALRSIVGVAGTVTTLAAWIVGVSEYSPELTHGRFFTWEEWEDAANFMIYQPTSVKAALPVMPPGREDVIGAGSLIWRQILRRVREDTERAGANLGGAYVSEHDILDGIALALLEHS